MDYDRITDPRKRRGIRHLFESVLALAVMAALSGMRSYESIAEWAKDCPKELLKRLRRACPVRSLGSAAAKDEAVKRRQFWHPRSLTRL